MNSINYSLVFAFVFLFTFIVVVVVFVVAVVIDVALIFLEYELVGLISIEPISHGLLQDICSCCFHYFNIYFFLQWLTINVIQFYMP